MSYKLIQFGQKRNMLDIIGNMYSKMKSKIKIISGISEESECYLGVRQGESLSPVLFELYINYFEEYMNIHGVDLVFLKMYLLVYAAFRCILLKMSMFKKRKL